MAFRGGKKNDLSEYGQRIFCITNGDLSVKLGQTSSKSRKGLFEARARILGQADIYVKTGSLLTLTCVMSQGPHDLGTVAWYRGSQAVVTSTRSENDIETEPHPRQQGLLSRGPRTVKTHRTCPAFRATWLFSQVACVGPNIASPSPSSPLCPPRDVARPFLDVIDDCHDDAVAHRAGKFTGPQLKKRINCRATVGPRLPSCKRPLSVNSMELSESTASETFP
ncbi:hypothetical protein G5I_11060 [Acromyrmex echinatior]|uniref:Ig-like domain-containing protein n=1 Tax=Acromyrmex echinatior TaxID=103372 RepID=F4WYK7_ACREC|nr:hypothetical protein G5I_11060 [Acromyrmex echinatior]